MTLFQRNGTPIEFNLIGLNDAELKEITDLIVKNGGKVGKNKEFPYIKFTNPKVSSSVEELSKLYDVQFLRDSITQSRLVDYNKYRLHKAYPSDNTFMSYFLFGHCFCKKIESKSYHKSVQMEDKGVQTDLKTECFSEATCSKTCSSVYNTAECKSEMSQTEVHVDEPYRTGGSVYFEDLQLSVESPIVIPCGKVYPVQMLDIKIEDDNVWNKPGTSGMLDNTGIYKPRSQSHKQCNEIENTDSSHTNDELQSMSEDGVEITSIMVKKERQFESQTTACGINEIVYRQEPKTKSPSASPDFSYDLGTISNSDTDDILVPNSSVERKIKDVDGTTKKTKSMNTYTDNNNEFLEALELISETPPIIISESSDTNASTIIFKRSTKVYSPLQFESDESEEKIKVSKTSRMPTRRLNFSNIERRKMIEYLVATHSIGEAKGLQIWKNMIADGILPGRTAHSVHNHFMKSILPHVDQLDLQKDILEQFIELKTNKIRRYRKYF